MNLFCLKNDNVRDLRESCGYAIELKKCVDELRSQSDTNSCDQGIYSKKSFYPTCKPINQSYQS